MDHKELLAHVQTALKAITEPRFFESERGFQGAFLTELSRALPQGFLAEEAIIEQEYQKRLDAHGLTIRPDVIIHEPFNPERHHDRREGNIAAFELKLKATKKEALDDFGSLLQMLDVLEYPLAVFINISAVETHAALVPKAAEGRIACFATALADGAVAVREEHS